MTETVEETAYVTDGNLKWINEEIRDKYDCSPYRIPLRNKNGIIVEYSLVDADDFEKVMKYSWCLASKYSLGRVNGKNIKLSHFIYKKPEGKNIIDHLDEDKLNNCKSNLRETSKSVNGHNITKALTDKSTSAYKGVNYRKDTKKYKARAKDNKKEVNLGCFEKEIDAAIAYDTYTYKLYGKNANNNKLIKYEDTINIDINDLIKNKKNRDLPFNIAFNSNKYFALKEYDGYCYPIKRRDTLDEALIDLQNINILINHKKTIKELKYLQQKITRNDKGIAIIVIKCINFEDNIDVLVDDCNWYRLNRVTWSYNKGYAINGKYGSMHRFLMEAKDNDIVDHKNHIGYDNRICNLTSSTSTLNNHNRVKSKNSSSKYYGVGFSKKSKKWRSRISYNHKEYYLGEHDEEIEAAKAYNEKAIELYGEHANLNVIIE